MGEVYAAFDETLKRRVALKVVRAEHRLDARAKARFLREAQILSNLDHPNICRVFNYVETPGQDWLVLELIEGRNLKEAIADRLTAGQRLKIAAQMAEVLVVTHAAGVVHRDLKPGNVMVTGAGDVKVLDFGLARSLPAGRGEPFDEEEGEAATALPWSAPSAGGGPAASDVDMSPSGAGPTRSLSTDERPTEPVTSFETERGALVGTTAYMSPEQARGRAATTASDMYSLGLLLQELFTGVPPFRPGEDSTARLERARRGEVPPPRGIDPDLARLIQRLKSVVPSERPTAMDTLERLRWIAAKPARRFRRLAVAVLVLLAALAGAKYTMDVSRERTAAVAARRDADGRRAQAENLIRFMLGDLRKKLETVGRLEILDGVGSKALDYFASVPESALTDDELADRSAALYQIGDVRITQGRLAEAVKPLEQSLALATALAARHPNDGKRLFDLAQSHFWVGFVEWRQRRLEAALVHFREYLRIAERLVAIDAKNAGWRLELASANSNIGSVLDEQGHPDEALERFEATLAIESGLLERSPDDTTLRRAVAASNNTIGAELRALGRLDESLAHHRTELALQEDLVRREPGTAQWRQYRSVSHNRVAMLLDARGAEDEAAAHAGQALSVIEQLAAEDPSNLDWQREVGRSHYRVGVVSDARGAFADARLHLERAVDIMQRAAARDPLNPARQRDLAEARAALAYHFLASGDAGSAVREARTAQQVADGLLARTKDDLQAARLRGLGLVLQARAWTRAGKRKQAADAFGQAAAALGPIARASRDYAILDPWALALAGTGRSDEAKEVVKRLTGMGYRNRLFVSALAESGLARPSSTTR